MKKTNDSPVVIARHIPEKTRLLLWVRAGGRCEFDGCNDYLFEHHVTLDNVNLADVAHVVAFKSEGPRGAEDRPEDIHDIANLMLLCLRCHKLIDDSVAGERFTVATLRQFKSDHEERILRLTELKPDRKTFVLQMLGRIGNQTASIPRVDIFDAVAPRYPAPKGCIIDLTTLTDGSDAYYELATGKISKAVTSIYEPSMDSEIPHHLSVFALAPMPLLFFLGRQLSNKTPTDLYQRHRDSQTWAWKTDGEPAIYDVNEIQKGDNPTNVAIVLSLSAALDIRALPVHGDRSYTIYKLTLKNQVPSPLFLRQRQDLEAFRTEYHKLMALILRDHGNIPSVDVFPAVPAPIAVLAGFEVFPKVSPTLRIFDNDKSRGGWVHVLDIG